jgi:L-asparagine transporter-like permease
MNTQNPLQDPLGFSMDLPTFLIIATTVVIHLIGIGLFIVYLAAGKPTSVQQLKAWWKNVRFLPRWH